MTGVSTVDSARLYREICLASKFPAMGGRSSFSIEVRYSSMTLISTRRKGDMVV